MKRVLLPLLLLVAACAGRSPARATPAAADAAAPRQAPFAIRPPALLQGDRWLGQGVSYGPYREGQRPGGPSPSRAQLREDLELLRSRWTLLRLYSADDTAEEVLSLIRAERLPFKVLLGAWIAPEARLGADGAVLAPLPESRQANRGQVETAVRLANAYPEVVLALVVGNETQVSWSAHRLPAETLVGWLRRARQGTSLPVATADDFGFWLEAGSEKVAGEVDFIVLHAYAMWNGQPLERALAFTQEKYAAVAQRHPGRVVLLGEAGWATRKHVEGEQATLIKAEPGEGPQRAFYRQFTEWVVSQRIPSTWFEAFDEPWKGGPHPDEVEKHWGLFRADRTRKLAVADQP
jgi:exo-beta-1,3-glucanase (GH17 family)